jgi:hypothetical protein
MPSILGQKLASTGVDRNGERLSKTFLDQYAAAMAGKKHPLNSQHDLSRRTVGCAENYRVEPDSADPNIWVLLADVHLDDDVPLDGYGGFSIAGTEMIREPALADAKLLLAYPHYNDMDLVGELSEDGHLALGKWIKKSAGEFELGVLLGSLLAFLVTPVWDDVYKRKIAPRMDQLVDLYLRKLQPRGIGAELLQVVAFEGREVQIHFIPARRQEATCLRSDVVLAGLQIAIAYLASDQRARDVGVNRIVLFYDEGKSSYELHRTEYADGTVEHAA